MKILVPVDGSQNSMEAVKVALQYAKTAKADVYLMTVSPFISGLDLEISAGAMDKLNENLNNNALTSGFNQIENFDQNLNINVNVNAYMKPEEETTGMVDYKVAYTDLKR